MVDRATFLRACGAILAVSALSLLFIASYVGALHEPKLHAVPLAVARGVPSEVTARLAAGDRFDLVRVADADGARRAIDRRDAYGALVPASGGVQLITAPAAGPSVAQALTDAVVPALRRGGARVTTAVAHPLPRADGRGLVGFYTAVGWVVAGYLGATFLGIVFGTRPGRRRLAARLLGVGAMALLVGFGGAAMAAAIGDLGSWALVGVVGALTVAAVGAATVALQSVLGLVGTGVAIGLFVVLGNPASGGPFATELLPGLWRVTGPLIPTGAATTAVRNVSYFPDASWTGPLLCLLAWLVVSVVVALVVGGRRTLTEAEAETSLMGAAAP